MERHLEPDQVCDCSVCVLIEPPPVLPARLVRKHKRADRMRALYDQPSLALNQSSSSSSKRQLATEPDALATSATTSASSSSHKRARVGLPSFTSLAKSPYISLREARERDGSVELMVGLGSEDGDDDDGDIEGMFWEDDDDDAGEY